ncbi:hypothetical protein [Nocardia sp. alder85J]|uniref:hypothetical protein n=1 Tax=Nocardia sp. alder85J TaxID=2862949 RepID=UPI001CD62239|nr:hypothetical protein [Nocardia sp. alder85J]MCX4090922.1 hypothetical protein [Nocardia sp. alder85J]
MTVIVAPPGSSAAIRDVLTDLSATGLVRDVFWLDHGEIAAPPGRTPVLRLRDGAGTAMRLADMLAGPTPVAHVAMCVLVTTMPGDAIISRADELALSAYLDEHRNQDAVFDRLRVLVAHAGAELPPGAQPAFAGRHNFVVAPEDAHGPALGHESLTTDDPVLVARYATPVLVGLCGLWSVVDHRPLDGLDPLPGETLRVVRSFYRRLDCGAVSGQLRGRLLDVSGRTPLPYNRIAPVIYVGDVALETHRMAEQLWAKHASTLKGPRQQPAGQHRPTMIGWREVLRMFLSFVWATLRNTPNAWLRRFADERATTTARIIQNLVLGNESAYRVVVDGKTADGRAARWTAYAPAARQLADALGASGMLPTGPIPTSDLSALWRDYASAALTLCDAQERSDRLPPAQIGVNRAIVPTTDDVIRAPQRAFRVTPDALAAEAGIASVSPADIPGIVALAERLRTMTVDRSLETDAADSIAALDKWTASLRRTFGWAFGRRLDDELGNTILEVRRLLARIVAVAAGAGPRIATGRQRLLVALTWCTSVLFVLGLTADITVVATGRLSLRRGAEIAAGSTIVLTLVMLISFVLTQRELFRLINRLRQDAGAIDVDNLNLCTALRDVERLSQATAQYQSWSQVLGSFLADPLGFTGAPDERAARIRWGLPRSTAVGSAWPDDHEVDEVAADLRATLFRVGWLSAPWARIVGSVGEQLGPVARDVRRDPDLIQSLPGAGSGSILDIWAQRITADGVPAWGSAAMWRDALRELGAGRIRDRLIRAVEYFENGSAQRVSVEHFRAGIGDAGPAAAGHFDSALFTDPAVAGWRNRVTADSPFTFTEPDLGWIAVTTQFSDGVSFDDLTLGGGESAPPPPPPPPTPIF